jgi:anthranilate phosphoribosyltransferase
MTITGPTYVAELKDGKVRTFEVSPQDAGLATAKPEAIKGADAATNAAAVRAVLAGEKNAFRDIVLFNAAAALVVAGKASDLKSGAALAAQSIDSGKASAVLAKMVAVTNAVPA